MVFLNLLNSKKSLININKLPFKNIFQFFVILESFLLINFAHGHREHKVYNIKLYPDKHSWCNVLPIKQVITHPGCKSVEIDNNVCVGACFSYSIPHTEPSDPGEVIVPYCDSCQPSENKLIHINLECDADETEKKTQQLKMVQYITNCTCTSCEKDKYLEQILRGNSAKEIKESQNDTPDLLDAFQNHEEINPKLFHLNPERSKLLKNLMNSQIMTLLKNIQSENSQKDKEELTEALKLINEQSKEKVSDSTIAALVNSFYRENIELDLPKLLETLQALDNSKYFEKLRKNNNNNNNNNNHEGSGVENNYNNDNDDNSNNDDTSFNDGSRISMGHLKGSHVGMGFNHYSHHNHHKRKHHEVNYDTENSNEDYEDRNDDFNEQHHNNDIEVENIPNKLELNEHSLLHKIHHKIHTHHMHHKHHHSASGITHHNELSSSASSIGIGSSTDSTNNEVDKPSSTSDIDEPIHIQVHPKHHHHHIHHHLHHLGEHMGHGHLTHGPHGSLVIEPDNIDDDDDHVEIQHSNGHERINVNPTDLKPNHAGTLLSYSSHRTSSNSA